MVQSLTPCPVLGVHFSWLCSDSSHDPSRSRGHFAFNLQDATRYHPITDLRPYLGEKGHLVILHQSSALTRESYIHAHAIQNTLTNQIHFVTRFPQPGRYKLWGQFNRDGEIITADFWVEVVPQ